MSFVRPRPGWWSTPISRSPPRSRYLRSASGTRKALAETPAERVSVLRSFDLLTRPRFALARCASFCTWARGRDRLLDRELSDASKRPRDQRGAGRQARTVLLGRRHVGRFIGAYLLRIIAPGKVLAAAATTAIGLIAISSNTQARFPATRCSRSVFAIPSCFQPSSRSRAKDSASGRRRVPASSAWPSSAGRSCRSSRARPPISRT